MIYSIKKDGLLDTLNYELCEYRKKYGKVNTLYLNDYFMKILSEDIGVVDGLEGAFIFGDIEIKKGKGFPKFDYVEPTNKVDENLIRVKYLRDSNYKPYATLVCIEENGYLCFGWSLCDKKDSFIKHVGRDIAIKRAKNFIDKFTFDVPQSIRNEYYSFVFQQLTYIKSK